MWHVCYGRGRKSYGMVYEKNLFFRAINVTRLKPEYNWCPFWFDNFSQALMFTVLQFKGWKIWLRQKAKRQIVSKLWFVPGVSLQYVRGKAKHLKKVPSIEPIASCLKPLVKPWLTVPLHCFHASRGHHITRFRFAQCLLLAPCLSSRRGTIIIIHSVI